MLRNTLYLSAAQILCIPLSVALNATMARYLGPEDFGNIYLATTLTSFGFLAVNWGQAGALPAAVARDRSQAGALLGASITWRVLAAVLVYLVLAAGCHVLGYSTRVQWALGLVFLSYAFTSFTSACQEVIRGFERTDIAAYEQVGGQLTTALLVIGGLLLGGGLRAVLWAQVAASIMVLMVVLRLLRWVGIVKLSVRRSAITSLLQSGTPFALIGVAMVLQPNVDALYMSKLAPLEVMGWYAVARRLIGVLVYPAAALIGALYPTLCRLHVSDKDAFKTTSGAAIRAVSLLVVPVSLGCLLFPEIGITIFNRSSFGPSEGDLRVLSLFLFLLYFTMPLGTCVMAAGRQKAWTVVQTLCVVVSLVLDPILIPWTQRRYGNGGLGVCASSVVSELVVVLCGIALAPRGLFDRRLRRSLGTALLAGVAMAAVALLTRPISAFVRAPLAVAAYAVALLLTGGLDKEQLGSARAFIARKLSRTR